MNRMLSTEEYGPRDELHGLTLIQRMAATSPAQPLQTHGLYGHRMAGARAEIFLVEVFRPESFHFGKFVKHLRDWCIWFGLHSSHSDVASFDNNKAIRTQY